MSRIPLAVQVYSVRHQAEKDLAGTLAAIKEMGYEGVEFAGFYGHSAEEVRKMLEENGLACAGAHVGLNTLLGEELEKSIAFHQTIGNKFLIVPWLPEEKRNTPEATRETAVLFNEIAAKLAPHGMRTGYHNHHVEFQPFPGTEELPWDVLFGNTDTGVVMQLDTGNARHGGAETLPILQKFPGRAGTLHLKEYDTEKHSFDPPVGEGTTPWKEIFAEVESTGGTEWYIVEYEAEAFEPLEGIKRCLTNLKAMGK